MLRPFFKASISPTRFLGLSKILFETLPDDLLYSRVELTFCNNGLEVPCPC